MNIPAYLQPYINSDDIYSIRCPFCQNIFHHRCNNCRYEFTVRIENNRLTATYIIVKINDIKYSIAQYYDFNQFIIFDTDNWNSIVNIKELIELDFNNVEEQIETLMLFS